MHCIPDFVAQLYTFLGDLNPHLLLTGASDSEEGMPGRESLWVGSAAPSEPVSLLHFGNHKVVWPAAMEEFLFFQSMFAV